MTHKHFPDRVDPAFDQALEQLLHHPGVFAGALHQSEQAQRQENQTA
jgi:hypothetical protein